MIKGSGRIVFFCGRFVLKFCRIQPLTRILPQVWDIIWAGGHGILPIVPFTHGQKMMGARAGVEWCRIPDVVSSGFSSFRENIRQNLTEYRCWKVTRAPFLAPTYITLGFVNIQKRERGQQPSRKEMTEMLEAIAERTGQQVYQMNKHCVSWENFIKTQNGIRIIDYGDGGCGPKLFPEFIGQWQNEIKSVLCRPAR